LRIANYESQGALLNPLSAIANPPSVHGALDYEELERLGLKPDDVLDFSSNVNPYGPAEGVHEAIANVALDRYPDRKCLALQRSLGKFLDLPEDCVLPANGSSELIWLTALAFIKPGDSVLVLGPTYCEYARAAELMGGQVSFCVAREEHGFVFDAAEIDSQIEALQPKLVFLCNPNNPTGAVLEPDAIAAWAKRYRRTLFVVDEAYLAFAAGLESVLDVSRDNVLVLRSMTKDFGLAGLRLGYAIANRRLIVCLQEVQPPWSVSGLAQAAGVAALRNIEHRQHSLELLTAGKQELVKELTEMQLPVVPSALHFFLVNVNPTPKRVSPLVRPSQGRLTSVRYALLKRGVLVRDCASFGLPAFIRISTRRPEENQRLVAALREVF
jgi:histidinol-phosphate aminotransferase